MRYSLLVAAISFLSSAALAEAETPPSSPGPATPVAPSPPPPPNSPPPPYGSPPQYNSLPPQNGAPPYGLALPVPEPVHPRRSFSLTFSPIHLALPIVELTGEFRVQDKIGIALIAGAGRVTDNSGIVRISATAYEAGAHFRYYVVGDFRHGMQLGAELLYLHISDANLSVKGEGLAVGPFVGYKYTADVGFTFYAQLGFEYIGLRATATNGANTGTASGSQYIPLLNLNVGWSF